MKNKIEQNERILARIRKELLPIKKEAVEAVRLWTLGYKKFLTAQKSLEKRIDNKLTVDPVDKHGVENKTVKQLWDSIRGWEKRSIELTKRRDIARAAMVVKESEIVLQEKHLSDLLHEYQIHQQQVDGMIDNVFMLNDGVVLALEQMDKFLATQVYPMLHEKGTQKMIVNSTITKKITIMTNTITVMDVAMVEEAKREIDNFFARINPHRDETEEQDAVIVMLSELVKELLVIKIKVQAGPNLSKFLSMDIPTEFFELKNAQKFLAGATNYHRSGLYVRLFVREHKDDIWKPVRQS